MQCPQCQAEIPADAIFCGECGSKLETTCASCGEAYRLRSKYAALRMQDSVSRYAGEVRRSQGIPVTIRVGLNSGEVIVGSVGDDLRMDYTAVGQTTHLAPRMEQMAIPGSIMVSHNTHKLTDGFSKGFTDSHAAMDTFNTRLAGGISTAYRDGVLDFGEMIFLTVNESVERMGPIEIDVIPNVDAFMILYDDLKSGKIPDTGG